MLREAAAFRWRVLTSAPRARAGIRPAVPLRSGARSRAAPARSQGAGPGSRPLSSRQPDLFGPHPQPEGAQARSKPGPIRVGTSGYSFADWVGVFYPAGTRSG